MQQYITHWSSLNHTGSANLQTHVATAILNPSLLLPLGCPTAQSLRWALHGNMSLLPTAETFHLTSDEPLGVDNSLSLHSPTSATPWAVPRHMPHLLPQGAKFVCFFSVKCKHNLRIGTCFLGVIFLAFRTGQTHWFRRLRPHLTKHWQSRPGLRLSNVSIGKRWRRSRR